MTKGKEFVLSLSKTLFWDVDIATIKPQKHAPYIIERVLSRGTWEEFKKLIAFYGKTGVIAYATQLRYMDRIVLAFCVTYFNISKEKFRFSIKK